MKIIIWVLMFFYAGLTISQVQSDSDNKPVIRLSPKTPLSSELKMRPVDRDWSYFKAVSCERIQKHKFHSSTEEMLLAKRKSQCINKYQKFFSQPIEQ
ncbi:MAG: hypothetical protein ACJA0N_002817 [Pseudohongiellaceae bacterium]|jgi:hypothetical protein